MTRSKVLIHPDIGLHFTETELICPDIIPDPSKKRERVGYGNLYDIEAPGVYVISQHIYAPGTYDAPPGKYLAVFLCRFGYHSSFNPYPLQFLVPPVFDFIYLDVVEGDW